MVGGFAIQAILHGCISQTNPHITQFDFPFHSKENNLMNPKKLRAILTKDLVSLYFNNKYIWPSRRSFSQLGCIHGKKPRLKTMTK